MQVPYLTEADVAEIVILGGGDPKKWARSILAFSGGHPQLVDARVAGLRRRGWNENEILTDLVPRMGMPNDLEEERKAVRSRLLQDLEVGATELLLRLSLLLGNFDRGMALVAAGTPVAIPHAGLVFDFLVGPWIEQVGPDRYRLSPLLKDSGSAGLGSTLCYGIKSHILKFLLTQRPFPADQLLQVFVIAFQQNDHIALRWFAGAVFSASSQSKGSRFKRLAQELSVFTIVDRGEGVSFIQNDGELSALLRLAQLRVAVATEDMERATKLVDKALFEIAHVPKKSRTNLTALLSVSVMLEPHLPLPPARWLAMLLDFVALPAMQPILKRPLSNDGLFGGLPAAATPDEMMFITRASALKNVEELAELVRTLEERPKATRDRYIGAAARTNRAMHLIVSSSWLADVKRPAFNAREVAATYHELSQGKTAKENPDLAVELLCAEATILADYANDAQGALILLGIAQDAYPNDYRLNRQRQKVFYRNSQHAEALAEFEKFCDRMPIERTLDRAYALREAGRSAAAVGELDKTRRFFEQACEASNLCGASMRPMTAGLLADCAILDFDAGRIESALDLMRRALLEGIPPAWALEMGLAGGDQRLLRSCSRWIWSSSMRLSTPNSVKAMTPSSSRPWTQMRPSSGSISRATSWSASISSPSSLATRSMVLM